MKRKLAFALRAMRRVFRMFGEIFCRVRLHLSLFINNVEYESIHSNGMPYFCVSPSGKCKIGRNFYMNNGLRFNPIGFPQPCTIYVNNDASLTIGDNVGISQASIICHKEIVIKSNVKIGGGVKIYDTDFHSLNPEHRLHSATDMANKKMLRVVIGENVLVGAGSIILKGVEIGDNSIVGAGSVVTKSIPSNEIWAGNPAHFVRKIKI